MSTVLFVLFQTISGTFNNSYAQEKSAYIKGTVFRGQSNEPLPDATILILENSLVTDSDEAGGFTIGPLPAGIYTVQATHLGFENKIIPKVPLEAGGSILLEISMIASTSTLD